MLVFIGEELDKQINKNKNRKDIIKRLNKVIKCLREITDITEFNKKSLGYKEFKGIKNTSVFGIDLGLCASSTMSAERIIASEIDLSDDEFELFKYHINSNSSLSKKGIILHFYCNHDEQNRKAKVVSKRNVTVSDAIFVDDYTTEEIHLIENSVALKSNYTEIIKDDYDNPNVHFKVLSIDKHINIINEYLNNEFIHSQKPYIVNGIAGSGKTEIIVRLIHDISKIYENAKILYVTFSKKLTDNVNEKCSTFKNEKIWINTLKELIGNQINKKDMEYENFNTFLKFLDYYINLNTGVDYSLQTKVKKIVKNYDCYKIYSEIYGIVFGYMLLKWDRGNTPLINFNDYSSMSDKDRMFYDEESITIYELAKLYYSYCKKNNLSSYNEESINIIYQNNKIKYDYVFIDEIQDLTECQIKMLYSLVKNGKNFYISGDIKQMINPTFFDVGRIKQMFSYNKVYEISEPPSLNSNFRNSKIVTNLINYYNEIRKKYVSSLKLENMIPEESKNNSSGNVYIYNGNVQEIIDKIKDASNYAIVVDDKELEMIETQNLSDDLSIFYTPQGIKGVEYENVLVLNMLCGKKEIYEELYNFGKKKDKSLHYSFNLFYVAITRAKYNLIILEKESTSVLKELQENVEDIFVTANIDEIDFKYDKDAFQFFKHGEDNITQGDYVRAKQNFKKCFNADNFDLIGTAKVEKYIDICEIYMKSLKDSELAQIFEHKGYYDFALKHYEESNDYSKAAIMCLMSNKENNYFEMMLKQNNINIFSLYSENVVYNNKLDEYFENKNKIINESNKQIDDYLKYINLLINDIK